MAVIVVMSIDLLSYISHIEESPLRISLNNILTYFRKISWLVARGTVSQ